MGGFGRVSGFGEFARLVVLLASLGHPKISIPGGERAPGIEPATLQPPAQSHKILALSQPGIEVLGSRGTSGSGGDIRPWGIRLSWDIRL